MGAYARRGVAQHGGHTSNNRLRETCSLGFPCTSLVLDIHVMSNWPLSKQSIYWPVLRDHIAGSSLQLIEVTCFLKLTADQMLGFSISLRAHVRLTCWKHFMIVQKPANAKPIRIITFSSILMFFLLYFVFIKLKTENLTAKLQNSNQNCNFSWVKDVRANCFCASLLRTRITCHVMPRHASSARAKY